MLVLAVKSSTDIDGRVIEPSSQQSYLYTSPWYLFIMVEKLFELKLGNYFGFFFVRINVLRMTITIYFCYYFAFSSQYVAKAGFACSMTWRVTLCIVVHGAPEGCVVMILA